MTTEADVPRGGGAIMAQLTVEDAGARRGIRERLAVVSNSFRALAELLTLDRLLTLAAVLALPSGLAAIILGWYGAAHTPLLHEQVPYLISGGLLGVGLLSAGGLLYLASWIARSSQLSHERDEQVRELLADIRDELRTSRHVSGVAAPAAPAAPAAASAAPAAPVASNERDGAPITEEVPVVRPARFVATPSGTMYHRPDCSVVAQRDDLRQVSGNEARMKPCGMCQPDA
jgi:hypothetical protein